MSRSRARRWAPAAVVALALAVRLIAIAADPGYEPRHDAFDYDRYAASIAAGDGYPESSYVPDGGPSALRAPGYPYALAAAYLATGDSLTAGRALGAVLGAVSVMLLYLLVRRIWTRRIALLAAGLAAIYPPLVGLSTELFSESLFIALLLAAVLCVLRCRETASLRWAAAAGALAGLAALTRGPGVVALLPLLIGLWFMRPRLSPGAVAIPAVGLLAAVMVLVPWTVRNAAEFGRFVPVATSTGFGLAGTYNPVSRGDPSATAAWRTPAIVPDYAPLFRAPGVDEGTLDGTLRREATGFAVDHPGYVAEVAANNLLRLAYLKGDSVVAYQDEVVGTGIGNRGSVAEAIGFGLAVALAVVGVFAILRSRAARAGPDGARAAKMGAVIPSGPTFLWLIPLLLVLVAAPVAGLPRYRIPADPFLLILAAIGAGRLLDLIPRRLAVSLALGAALAFPAAGCGGGEQPPETVAVPPDPAAMKAFAGRADAICADSLRRTKKLVAETFADPDAVGTSGLELTSRGLVKPGIAIRAAQAEQLRRLGEPPGDVAAWNRFVGLFDPIDQLSRERLRAGLRGDVERSSRLEALLQSLAADQRRAAGEFGLDDCGADVIGEVLG